MESVLKGKKIVIRLLLVKIDVECAESLVLKGSVILASQQKTMIFVEMHSSEEVPMQENALAVLQWCRENSYSAYYLKTHELISEAEVISHRGKCHLFLLPHDMDYPIGFENIKQRSEIAS